MLFMLALPIGFLTGSLWFSMVGSSGQERERMPEEDSSQYSPPGWLVGALIVVVLLVWASSTIYSMINTEYQPSQYIHIILLGLIGGALGGQFVRGWERDDRS